MTKTDLNPQQKKAIEYTDSPLLVLAGAGSGKTRVLTQKIAYLIHKGGIKSDHILAITFTNKAAKEMGERVSHLLSSHHKAPFIGTFHGFCRALLIKYSHHLGRSQHFVIMDRGEQRQLIKSAIKDVRALSYADQVSQAINKISQLKQSLISPEEYQEKEGHDSEIAKLYTRYQHTLIKDNRMDFDDLIFYAITLLDTIPEVLLDVQEQYKYVLVDEYQDTNDAQYKLIHLITKRHQALTVVGDFDQTIYTWRGARIKHLSQFENQFPGAKTITLEQNYRSKQPILDAANALIKHNINRQPKTLWSDQKEGEKPLIYVAYDENDEASYITKTIKILQSKHNIALNDMAILYRTNVQSRSIEEAFNSAQLPYQLVGGTRFYDRQEVKDMIAYLRLIQYPDDNIAFGRAINRPLRGIGKVAIQKLAEKVTQTGQAVMNIIHDGKSPLSDKQTATLEVFYQMILSCNKDYGDGKLQCRLSTLITRVCQESSYKEMLEKNKTDEGKSRLENIEELKTLADQYTTIQDFLHHVSLMSDTDTLDESEKKVSLMTLHHAKGLEFPVVFIIGVESGLLPHYKHKDTSEDALEEERRLAYVGFTRAKDRLYLTCTNKRRLFGEIWYHNISPFIKELPHETYVCKVSEHVQFHNGNIIDKLQDADIRYELLAGEGKPTIGAKEGTFDFIEGDSVNHKVWGIGQIISVSGDGDKRMYTINFSGEKKQLMAKYSPLTKA